MAPSQDFFDGFLSKTEGDTNFQQEPSNAQNSHRMRLAHLSMMTERMGVDGLAVCGD